MTKSLLAYVRESPVAHSDALDENQSLARQAGILTDFLSHNPQYVLLDARDYGFETKIIAETGSASTTEGRKKYMQLQRAVCLDKQIDGILSVKLDRVYRDQASGHSSIKLLRKYGKGIITVLDSVNTFRNRTEYIPLVSSLLLVAELERVFIEDRTTAGKRDLAKAGFHVSGHRRYGWDLSEPELVPGFRKPHRREIPNEAELHNIYRAVRCRENGLTAHSTAKYFAGLGLQARSGRSFLPTEIVRMLANYDEHTATREYIEQNFRAELQCSTC